MSGRPKLKNTTISPPTRKRKVELLRNYQDYVSCADFALVSVGEQEGIENPDWLVGAY
jgi:hypothetical protein